MREFFDAIVIGAGAAGGWAAKQLTEGGLRVVLLDAGRALDPRRDLLDENTPYSEPGTRVSDPERLQRQPIQSQCISFNTKSADYFVDDLENPYTTTAGDTFHWFRSRRLGGRTLLWGRHCYRFSELTLQAAARDEYGDDWPMSADELAPYYDRVEEYLGVHGQCDGIAHLPDGKYLPTPGLNALDRQIRDRIESVWPERRVIGARKAAFQRADDGRSWPASTSLGSTLAAAERTGRLTVAADAVVSHVTVDRRTGLADGVVFFDRASGEARRVGGRLVIVCASTIESTRILLNSKSAAHPQGLGNSSGILGHYLNDHISWIHLVGEVELPEGQSPIGVNAGTIYIPRFQNIRRERAGHLRGFGVFGGLLRDLPMKKPSLELDGPRTARGACGLYFLRAQGEMLPRFDNTVTLDPEKRDAFGIPCAKISCRYSDNELAMAEAQIAALTELAQAAGFQDVRLFTERDPPGASIHETGTARMGWDPKTSVLNRFNQLWDAKNVFVTDGSAFVSAGNDSPTLTIMALTVRACDYILGDYRKTW